VARLAIVACIAAGDLGDRPGLERTACMRWSVCHLTLLLLGSGIALAEDPPAPPGSFRAAQETGLDLGLRPVDLLNLEVAKPAAGSFRAAQEAGLTTPWSRELGPKWSLEGYQGPAGPPAWEKPGEPVGIKVKREL
jgi:hypothetical protein